MKKLVLILALCLAFGSAVLSAPNIVIYRYRGIDIKMLPANLITDSNTATDPWVRDDAKWSAGKKTALLIHGFSIFSQEKCRNGMIGLAAHLSVSRRVGETTIPGYDAVYAVEYPAKYNILDTAAALADMVNVRCSNLPKEMKIDVFAHSMGGLVARTAIEYPEVLLGTKKMSDRINHLVTMGTPHGGISSPVVDIFKEVLHELPTEVGDMEAKGLFMNMLNFTSSKKPQVPCDYYSIVGARSDCPKKFISDKHSVYAIIIKKIQDISYPVHDGLIEAASAGYDLSEVCHAFKKAQLDLNHDYIKSHSEVFNTIDRWMIDDDWFDNPLRERTQMQSGLVGYENWYPVPISTYDTTDLSGGVGRAIAFISNRDGEPAIYAKDMKQNDCYKIMSLIGMKEQFTISPGGNILLLGNDGRIRLLLIDNDKDHRQSFHRIYQPIKTIDLDITLEFFPSWEDDTNLIGLISGEIKRINLQFKQSSSLDQLDNLGNVLGGLGKKIRKLVGPRIGKKTTLEFMASSLGDDVQFITVRPDEQGCKRVCSIDRFCKVKKWYTPRGLIVDDKAGGPNVGQTGMFTFLGSGIGPVVFTSKKDGNRNIYRFDDAERTNFLILPAPGANPPESKVTKLTTALADDYEAIWACSAKKVYFTSKRSGVRCIYEMNADGTEQKIIDLK